MQYKEDLNRGLSHRFNLENGAFKLTGGKEKVNDSIDFLLSFSSVKKVYDPDFFVDILWLLQKPATAVATYRTLVLGKIKRTISRYIPFIVVQGISLEYDYKDRKKFAIEIVHAYNLEEVNTERFTRFIEI